MPDFDSQSPALFEGISVQGLDGTRGSVGPADRSRSIRMRTRSAGAHMGLEAPAEHARFLGSAEISIDVESLLTRGEAEPTAAEVSIDAPGLREDEVAYLLVDHDGLFRWHRPEHGTTNHFVLHEEPRTAKRGAVGGFLKRVVIAVAGKAVAKLTEETARKLISEREQRGISMPLHRFDADQYRADAPAAPDLEHMSSGRSLLFLHGTFSSPRGAFGAMDPRLMRTLDERYEGRMWAFHHPTVSVDPASNAEALASLLSDAPAGGRDLSVDVIAHSRGGLVARELAEPRVESPLDVGQVLFVATPNDGTPLASAHRLTDLIDMLTNVLGLIPDNGVTDIIELVMSVLTPIWEGLLQAVPGLTAMDPQGEYLTGLNSHRAHSTIYRAAASNFEPAKSDEFRRKLRDAATDLFFRTENDLVVPTRGVFNDNGAAGFPILDRVAFHGLESVDHGGFWRSQRFQHAVASAFTGDDPPPGRTSPAADADPIAEPEQALIAGDATRAAAALDRLDETARSSVGSMLGTSLTAPRGARGLEPREDWAGRVVIVPGLGGSTLSADGDLIWLDPLGVVFGQLEKLRLDVGDDRSSGLSAGGVHVSYVPLVDRLRHDWQIEVFPYDWRQSIAEAGEALARRLHELVADGSGTPTHMVAHSMGGLVVRMAAARDPAGWKKLMKPGGRVVMLGTPNRGSYSIVMTLTGDERMVQLLALADLEHSQAELQAVLAGFPGLYDLLPHPPEDAGAAPNLYSHQTWNSSTVRPDLLSRAEEFQREIARTEPELVDGPFRYIAGHGHQTPYRLSHAGGALQLGATMQGDGRVPHALGPLSGMRAYYSTAPHGDLIRDTAVLDAVDSLLHGDQADLPEEPPSAGREGRDELEDVPFTPIGEVDAIPVSARRYAREAVRGNTSASLSLVQQATGDLLGTKPTVDRGLPQLFVGIVHGSLEMATSPVVVGHYQGMPIDGAEGFLDQKIGGALSDRQITGVYPEAAGQAALVTSHRQRPPGALVICLGEFGGLTPTILTRGVREAALLWALAEAPHEAPPQGPEEIGLTSVLVGTPGRYGIPVQLSLAAIVEGVIRANIELQDRGIGDRGRIGSLTIIEYYKQKAEDATAALREVERRLPADVRDAVALEIDQYLGAVEGGRPGAPMSHDDGTWPRVLVSFELDEGEEPKTCPEPVEGDAGPTEAPGPELAAPPEAIDELRFTVLGSAARADEKGHEIETCDVERLVAAAGQNRDAHAQINNTLYELLLPNDVKLTLDTLENIHLVVDDHTANYPWEMLAGRDPTGKLKPLALRAGFLRQLRSGDEAKVRSLPRRPLGLHALVIGDPPTGYPRLPGARREAQDVADLLERSGGYEVEPLIYGAADEPSEARWLELRSSLYKYEYRILHIAAHGLMTPGDRARSGVVVGQDRLLTPLAFRQMSVVPELVFLNACHLAQTGAGAPTNLARLAASVATQLMREGVKAVVAAGWAVDDDPAAEFAQVFYEAVLRGENLGDAVKQARNAAHRLAPDSNTWGAYQCYGDPGFRLAVEAPSAGYGTDPVSESDLTDRLETEEVRAGVAATTSDLTWIAQKVRQRYVPLVEGPKADELRWTKAGTLAQMGETFKQLGCYADAVHFLRLALEADDATLDVRDIEQLVNCEARLAATWHREPTTQANGRELHTLQEGSPGRLLRTADDRMEALLGLGSTPERLAIKGSLYKKWAAVTRPGETRTDRLKTSRDAYKAAFGEGQGKTYHRYLWAQVSALLGEPQIHRATISRLRKQAETRLSGLAHRDHEIDFWSRVELADLLLTEVLLGARGGDGDEGASVSIDELIDRMTETYVSAFTHRSTAFNRATVIDHLDDICALDDELADTLGASVQKLRSTIPVA